MSFAEKHFPKANAEFVKRFNEQNLGSLTLPPTKQLIIVTCMGARIDPTASLGIRVGEAHVIRNAGGSAREALRSIIISQHMLGTKEIAVFRHTGCGLLTFTNDQFQAQLKALYPANSKEIDAIDFMAIPEVEPSLKADVEYLKSHPLIAEGSHITGWVYEVETGQVRQVM